MANPSGSADVSKGKRVPNLILEFDNEKGSEFRVQCEVGFTNKKDGARVMGEVAKGTAKGLRRAKKLVLANIDRGATPTFKKIVAGAFEDNIKNITRKRSGRR